MRVCPDCLGSGDMNPEGLSDFDRCDTCNGTGELPGYTLQLHPDPTVRDAWGVLTVYQMYQYRLWAEGYMHGWVKAQEYYADDFTAEHGGTPMTYPGVRDALRGLCDMPYEMACLIALWLTRDSAKMYFLSFTVVL
jgi:hypothetical protein